MISVLKNNNEIIVRCSKNELLSISQIKEIVKTIKRINQHSNHPCTIVVKSIKDVNFSARGKVFFSYIERGYMSNRIAFVYEN